MHKIKKTTKGFLIALTAVIIVNLTVSFSDFSKNNPIFPTAYAAEGDPEYTFEEEMDQIAIQNKKENVDNAQTTKEIVQDAAKSATKVHRIFAPLINYFAFKIGNFLGTDYIYQGAMGLMLHKIWVICRNLVNIAFVFYLLWIAVQTIFKQEGGMDDLKKNLVVFTLGLVAVNFSWLATKVILDSANVVTHAVFAIPSGISDPPKYEPCQVNTTKQDPVKGLCYPTKIIAPADAGNKPPLIWQDKEGEDDNCSKMEKAYTGSSGSAYDEDGTRNPLATEANEALQGRTSICMESLNLTKYDQNTATIYLTYGMARIQNLVNASASTGEGVQLAIGVLMSIALQIIYGIALAALFIALVVRMMMLWLLVAFSPFIVLLIGLGGEGGGEEVQKYLSVEQFLSWAFVPAKVGAIFVVSFIMISAGQSMGNLSVSLVDKLSTQSGFTFKILGQESLFAGLGSLDNLLWLLMTIVVLWMGVFAVLGKLEFVGSWFSRIGEAGKELATKAATLPYIIPWIPGGNGGQKFSLKTGFETVTGISTLNNKYDELMRGGSSKGTTKLSENVKKLDYHDYKQKLNSHTFKFEDANEMAKELKYANLAELMKEDPAHVKTELRRMKNADRYSENELNDFYNTLVKLNGGEAKAPEPAVTSSAPNNTTPPTTAQLSTMKAELDRVQAEYNAENRAAEKAEAKKRLDILQVEYDNAQKLALGINPSLPAASTSAPAPNTPPVTTPPGSAPAPSAPGSTGAPAPAPTTTTPPATAPTSGATLPPAAPPPPVTPSPTPTSSPNPPPPGPGTP